MSRTVAEQLAERARTHPLQVALHIPVDSVHRIGPTAHRAITFEKLHWYSDMLGHGLASQGIVPGTRVALMVSPGFDFFASTFALFKIGAIPVLIDPGMGIKNVGKCLSQAEPEAFIGSTKANLARRLFGWGKASVRITVNAGTWHFFCTRATDELCKGAAFLLSETMDAKPFPPTIANSLCAILFTSGSTGIAKGVEYTHAIFSAQIELLKATYGIEPGEIDFCTFPLFALFGAALGMSCVIPIMDASRPATIDPAKVRGQLRQFRCTNLFGSPAVLKRLASDPAADPADYASIRRVISAGAPATPAVLEAFTKLLPAGVPIYTPYGATECLPVANISSVEILNETQAMTEQGRGVCVGKPVAGIEVMVIPITDGVVAELDFQSLERERRGELGAVARAPGSEGIGGELGTVARAPGSEGIEIGEFVVRGPVVTPRYFRNPQATALAKIHDPTTGETLHRMGDVGYIDEQGRLWFCGRKSHRVVTEQGTLFTDRVEPVFNTVDGVVRTALVGVQSDGGTTLPVLCVETPHKLGNRKWFDLTNRLRRKAELDPQTAIIELFLQYPGTFPVDVRHNSKIFREKLAVWADKQLGPKWKGGPA